MKYTAHVVHRKTRQEYMVDGPFRTREEAQRAINDEIAYLKRNGLWESRWQSHWFVREYR